jgi:glutamate synthase domain-containing protein 2
MTIIILFSLELSDVWWIAPLLFLLLVLVRDVFFNKEHTIQHNFPVIGHMRYILESIGPELRQYIVANNREELPFNRSERSWIYASSKKENNYKSFGTDMDIHAPDYQFIMPALLPKKLESDHINVWNKDFLPCAKVMGAYNQRRRPYRPASIINISAMSYGSLSARAVESINRGCGLAGCYQNTGEGGLSLYHSNGADLVFQFGTAYFGVRDGDGNFSAEKLEKLVETHPFVRAIEIKLSQGAKPGKGGVLPSQKITAEIAGIRGVSQGKDVISPSYHKAFSNVKELLEFTESIADLTGLPVGIKAAVGRLEMWHEMAEQMLETDRGPDFIAIDGGEGGTGAAPPSFSDHVSLPFNYAFTSVYRIFKHYELTHRIVFIGSGKLGLPANGVKALAMGADIIAVAREAMMAIGCIQAQRCHTNVCPTGVATQNKWLQRGIHIPTKAERLSSYILAYRKEVLEMTHASGYEHPCEFKMTDVDLSMGDNNLTRNLCDIFRYEKDIVRFDDMQSLSDCPHLGQTPATLNPTLN